MANVFSYLKWRGDLSLEASALNEVDILILQEITYIPLEKYVSEEKRLFKDVLNEYLKDNKLEKHLLGLILSTDIVKLAIQVSESKRFSNLYIGNVERYEDDNVPIQYSNRTYYLDDKVIVSYQGSDDCIHGYIEDLYMVVSFPLPSHILALKYLKKIAKKESGEIYVAGHSKGGNLALYAALNCSKALKKRIKNIYNFDGPGFREGLIDLDKRKIIEDKIINICPSGSFVGLLFESIGKTEIVRSKAKGLYEHDLLCLEILKDQIVKEEKFKNNALNNNKEIEKFVSSMSKEDIEYFIVNWHEFFKECNVYYLNDLRGKKFRVVRNLYNFDKKARLIAEKFLLILFKYKYIARKPRI